MFIRKVTTKNHKTGKEYLNYKLVKSTRENGIPKQIVVLSLGNLVGLPRFEFTKQALNNIQNEKIPKTIFEKILPILNAKYYQIFDLQYSLTKIIGKETTLKYIDILIKYTDVFEKNCKLLAARIIELYDNQTGVFLYEKEIEELAGFYHKRLIEKEFKNKEKVNLALNQKEINIQQVDINSFTGSSSSQIGGEYLCYQAMEELKIPEYLSKLSGRNESQVNCELLAIIGRLLNPGSENETACWLNENSAALELYPLKSGRINKDYLYDAALRLHTEKNNISKYICERIEDIFNIESKIIIFDLTNSHFEGQMKKVSKAVHGKNKQKRNDCKQITLAMVTDEFGFCKYSRCYSGNIGETTTLENVLKDLSTLHTVPDGQKHCVIMDAGIASEENLAMMLRLELDYIAVSKSAHTDLISKVKEGELVRFKNKSNKELSAKLFSQDFEYENQKGEKKKIKESIVYIKSPLKELKEKSIDNKKCERYAIGLQSIEKTVANPRGQRSVEKINRRIGRLNQKNVGVVGYFKIELKDDGKNITEIKWERTANPAKEKKLGTYFIRTCINEKEEEKIWHLYRTINEVEDAFNTIKSDLNMRPNYHQNGDSVEAHISLCILAYQIVTFIRHRLKQKGIKYKWKKIKRIMSTQKYQLSAVNRSDGKTIWIKSCTRANANVQELYAAMGYKNIPYYRKSIIV